MPSNLKCPKGHDLEYKSQYYMQYTNRAIVAKKIEQAREEVYECLQCDRPYFEMDCVKSEVTKKDNGSELNDGWIDFDEQTPSKGQYIHVLDISNKITYNHKHDSLITLPAFFHKWKPTDHINESVKKVDKEEGKGCKDNPDQCYFEAKSKDGNPFNCSAFCRTHQTFYCHPWELPKHTCIDKVIESIEYLIATLLYKIEESEPTKLFARALSNKLKELKDK